MIYLDNGATTVVDKEVVKAMLPYFTEKYGNASSVHDYGEEARIALGHSRKVIANAIGAKADEIIFTSGGTESNNFALKGLAFANKNKKHIITTKIEHDCVLNACKWLETQGYDVTYLNVDREGFVNQNDLAHAIRKDTLVVSIIHGNNEIGTIQDIAQLGKICREKGVLFHTDSCQSFTKVPINVKKQNVDLMTLNAHKIHGPKGVGALYVRDGIKITPLMHGGGHEKNLRSGTENISGIVGFAKAVQLAKPGHVKQMAQLRDMLIESVLKIEGTTLNGPRGDKRLCNNANFIFKNVEGEAIGSYLESNGICSSTGSACASHSLEPSHVLIAIGLKPEESHGSLRLTLSRFTTKEEIEKTVDLLPKIVKKLRGISPFDRLVNKL